MFIRKSSQRVFSIEAYGSDGDSGCQTLRISIETKGRAGYSDGMKRIQLKGISPRAWEHPADRAALAALRSVPGLNEVVKFFLGMTGEKSLHLLFLSSSVRVNEKQFPRITKLVEEACHVLDVEDRPELFVTQNPFLNAGAVGVKKPFIIVNSSMLDTLDDEELLAVVAHELGHILSGHVLYKTLLWILLNVALFAIRIPVAQVVLLGVLMALKEWDRKSELSADRAGLLVVQNPEVSNTVLMKLAGGKHLNEMELEEFVKQAEEYDAAGDVLDGFYKILNLLNQSHPFPVLRVQAINKWVTDGEFDRIKSGEYPTRTEEEENMARDFSEASRAYREDLKSSKDPLAQAVSSVGESLESVRQEAEKFFSSLFGGGKGPEE
jgi:Zn-dependent protease with chaperone function